MLVLSCSNECSDLVTLLVYEASKIKIFVNYAFSAVAELVVHCYFCCHFTAFIKFQT